MAALRPLLLRLLAGLRLDALARPLHGGAGAVLMFHRVQPDDPTLTFGPNRRNSVTPGLFCRLLDALAAAGIAAVTLEEAAARLAAPRPGRFVCLTFDDGYRDNHDILLPILEARRVPAIVYVAPGLVDGTAPLWWYGLDQAIAREGALRLPLDGAAELPAAEGRAKHAAYARAAAAMLRARPDAVAAVSTTLAERYGVDFAALARRHMMGWDMVRRLAASPWVTIGAHTLSHPSLATLDEAAALAEMGGSRERLEAETGLPVRHFAYPFGTPVTTGPREARLAQALGFRTAVTTHPGNLFPAHLGQPCVWPRHGIGPEDGPEAVRVKLSGLANALRRPLRRVVTAPLG
ncbi:polysaccharide deacetylase family protein [Roseomonas sp. OT10]|uniref:polysaccharide deacetylase family protein n=1 Tax=Roseomonas cutis TaxID=2897332 RepID=UPI001E51C067|nr:polysaccharide deacetylase family protein [Roseomonas sp. OT10]UFN49841.1 polysaccharide deacetylase family protein [Roseomonas sp. OT10]